MDDIGATTGVKVVQFSSTEKIALQRATDTVLPQDVSVEEQLRAAIAPLVSVHRLIPFQFETFGASIRGIQMNVHENANIQPWRQALVKTLVVYHRHYGHTLAGGNIAWQHNGNGEQVRVNFHELAI